MGNTNLKAFIVQSALHAAVIVLLSFVSIDGSSLIFITGLFTVVVSAAVIGMVNSLINPLQTLLKLPDSIAAKACVTVVINAIIMLLMRGAFGYKFYFGGFFRFLLALILMTVTSLLISSLLKVRDR